MQFISHTQKIRPKNVLCNFSDFQMFSFNIFLHSFLEATSYIFLILFQKTYLGASLTKIVPVQISICFKTLKLFFTTRSRANPHETANKKVIKVRKLFFSSFLYC
jgi:hypothetical protein